MHAFILIGLGLWTLGPDAPVAPVAAPQGILLAAEDDESGDEVDFSDEEEINEEVIRRKAREPKKPKKAPPPDEPAPPIIEHKTLKGGEEADEHGGDRAKDSKPNDPNRAQAFVAGASDDLRHQAGQITNVVRGVMRGMKGVTLLDLGDRLKAEPPAKTREFQNEAREALKTAKAAFLEMEYPKVEENARLARDAFEKMGGYLEPIERYKEALLLLAVASAMQGDQAKAQAAFLDLLIMDPHMSLPKANYEAFVVEQLNKVRESLDSQPRGSLSVKTNPPGGSLYLDGTLRGVTPDSLDGLIAGRHLVVVQQPGYVSFGKVVTVEAGELTSLNEKLEQGKAGGGFLKLVERACKNAGDGNARGEVLSLGQAVGMDWVILGQLYHEDPDVTLRLFMVDLARAESLFEEKLTLEGGDYGQEEEVRRFSQRFLEKSLKALRDYREKGDPLASRQGTEEWNRDESDTRREHRDDFAREEGKKQNSDSDDPLDDTDGTEDW
ncbi:MAG TPA: PEGA domain-containing protein [Myxococcota bacterium]|nr:PEGA domain-containing protein [Myxococcota bacterium]HRY94233.1 PEGA domain-containing protein [Myxococcota bacterium]